MDTTGTLLMPPGNSTVASDVDGLFYFILYASIAFFAIVIGATILFIMKYRRKGETSLTSSIAHSTPLEIAWTLIPTILIVIVFLWGFKGFLKLNVVPANAIEIKTTGQKWFWSFDYPGGANSVNELVVPVGRPVKLLMSSKDVIHSFYVPNFRTKMDVLPNRYSITWFEATDIGEYDLFCTEFCGKGHSEMIGKVKVVSKEDFEAYLEAGSGPAAGESLEEYGKRLFVSKACITCHSVDGTKNTGPTFAGLFGRSEKMADGEMITVDENYMRESILNPGAKVVDGYQNVMPTFQGILKDQDIDALILYIKSLEQ
jgi:cytochrome c oxidase subunit 2